MRILALQETDWVARNPIMHHRMLEELSRRGDEVCVLDYDLAWRDKYRGRLTLPRRTLNGFSKFHSDSSVTLIRPPLIRLPALSRMSWLAANWREIRMMLDDHRPDVVVAYGISNALLGAVMAQGARVPFVFHLLDALHTLVEPPSVRRVARIVEGMALRRADHVVVINTHLGDYAESMGVAGNKITVIPAGSAPRTIPSDLSQKVRQRLDVQDHELLLVFVGWLYEFSGMRELAKALAGRKAEFPDLKIAIVGGGDLEEELRSIRDRDLGSQLLLVGQRPQADIAAFIAASDACLLPALRHPAMEHIVPAKIGEYMELGKPVIMTRLPGLLAEFEKVEGILWIDHPADVLHQVSMLGSDARVKARAAGANVHEFACGREDWSAVTARFRTVLASSRP